MFAPLLGALGQEVVQQSWGLLEAGGSDQVRMGSSEKPREPIMQENTKWHLVQQSCSLNG